MIGSRQNDYGGDACNIWYIAVSCGVPGLLQISILASAGGYISSTVAGYSTNLHQTDGKATVHIIFFGFMTYIPGKHGAK